MPSRTSGSASSPVIVPSAKIAALNSTAASSHYSYASIYFQLVIYK